LIYVGPESKYRRPDGKGNVSKSSPLLQSCSNEQY
jgi:hypothetical protein